MPTPTAAELNVREKELNERAAEITRLEDAIVERIDEAAALEQSAQEQVVELARREREFESHVASRADDIKAALATPENATYSTLPDPLEGHGFVVVEAPLPLVAVFASLHPSERATMCAQVAGAMRMALMETGKLRRIVDLPVVELAVLAAGDMPGVGVQAPTEAPA